jgi:hypothetical protein
VTIVEPEPNANFKSRKERYKYYQITAFLIPKKVSLFAFFEAQKNVYGDSIAYNFIQRLSANHGRT